MKETIASNVGLDIDQASVAPAIADTGRAAPRFIGTVNPSPAELCKAPRQKLRPKRSRPVHEAGSCVYGCVRYLRQQPWRAPSRLTRSPTEQRTKTDRRDALLLRNNSETKP